MSESSPTEPSKKGSSSLKVAILPFAMEDYRFDFVMDLQALLKSEGHTLLFPDKSMTDLRGDIRRVANMVERVGADAWIVIAGSKEVLTWFIENSIPAFAIFGRRQGLPIPSIGPGKESAYRALVRKLAQLGHRNISLLTRPLRRKPEPGVIELAFLDELEKSKIKTGPDNLPDWDGRADSLSDLLDSMFRSKAPTAIVVDEASLFFAVQHLLARRGILAPEHVSLACTDWDPYFEEQRPSIAHIHWDSRLWVKRISSWLDHVGQGESDVKQSLTNATFVAGDSIGAVPKDK